LAEQQGAVKFQRLQKSLLEREEEVCSVQEKLADLVSSNSIRYAVAEGQLLSLQVL
jgi:hypothetical protein